MKVLDRDWDILLVLDACRYDYFEKYNTIPGKLEKVQSAGHNTLTWAVANFPDYYEDIIYLSANPYLGNKWGLAMFNAGKHFLLVEDIWDWGWEELLPPEPELGYGPLSSVPPKHVLNSLSMHINSGKRIIAHFLQPHAPYIGKHTFRRDIYKAGEDWEFEEIKAAYSDNLLLILEAISQYLSSGVLDGKHVVITSDHGDMHGETEEELKVEYKPKEYPWLKEDRQEGPVHLKLYIKREKRYVGHGLDCWATRDIPWLEVDL